MKWPSYTFLISGLVCFALCLVIIICLAGKSYEMAGVCGGLIGLIIIVNIVIFKFYVPYVVKHDFNKLKEWMKTRQGSGPDINIDEDSLVYQYLPNPDNKNMRCHKCNENCPGPVYYEPDGRAYHIDCIYERMYKNLINSGQQVEK